MFDLKHIVTNILSQFSKISKELQNDYTKTDGLVRQQIELTNSKTFALI